MKLNVPAENIYFKNINQFVEIWKTHFGEIEPMDMAKHKLQWLY